MALTNHERVGKALDLLAKGLRPFIERSMKASLGDRWQEAVGHAIEGEGAKRRREGFRDALATSGVAIAPAWEVWVPTTLMEDGQVAGERILGLAERPSALFVTTDRQAMAVVNRLLEGGVRVPEDIAVVGYDDIPYAACSRVPLTTVAIPMRRMGEQAAEILFDRLDGIGSAEPRQVLLVPELLVRGSNP